MIQDLFSNGIVRLYHISTTYICQVCKKCLTSCGFFIKIFLCDVATVAFHSPGNDQLAYRDYTTKLNKSYIGRDIA